jgi:hypothetical protein
MSTIETSADRPIVDASKERLAVDRIVPAHLRRYSLFVWLVIAASLAAISAISAAWMDDFRWSFLGLCLPLAAGIFAVPLAFTACHRWLVEWGRGTPAFAAAVDAPAVASASKLAPDAWVARQLSLFNGSVAMLVSGAAVSLFALTIYILAGYPVGQYGFASILSTGILLLSAFLAGIGLHAIFCGTRMIWRFGDFQITVKSHKFGILSTGRALVRCYFAVGLVWGIYVSSAVLGSPQFDLRMAAIPLLAIAAPAFVAILASFVICQIPLHNRMLEYKRTELLKVERKLDQVGIGVEELTGKMLQDAQFLEAKRGQILALPEWPSEFRTLLGAFGSSVTPALLSSAVTAVVKLWGPMVKS